MTIYQRMDEVFRVADVPGFLQAWRKTDEAPELPDLYAVYNVDTDRCAQSADDAPIFWLYDVTIYVYGIEDVSAAVAAIEDALSLEGFSRPRAHDGYARVAGEHIYVNQIDAVFVDFGEYGE